jgi:hypothetical protein
MIAIGSQQYVCTQKDLGGDQHSRANNAGTVPSGGVNEPGLNKATGSEGRRQEAPLTRAGPITAAMRLD